MKLKNILAVGCTSDEAFQFDAKDENNYIQTHLEAGGSGVLVFRSMVKFWQLTSLEWRMKNRACELVHSSNAIIIRSGMVPTPILQRAKNHQLPFPLDRRNYRSGLDAHSLTLT